MFFGIKWEICLGERRVIILGQTPPPYLGAVKTQYSALVKLCRYFLVGTSRLRLAFMA